MAKKTCPNCGAPVESSRSVCPNCRVVMKEKRSLIPYLIIGGIIVVVILVAAVLLMSPAPQPITIPSPVITVLPTEAAVSAPQAPSCMIAITGSKMPPSTIQLRVMTSTCSKEDITALTVSVNGAQKGTLGTNPGASGTFAGTSGINNVVVVADYANGATNVVYQNAAL
ncbi:zinc ribbon domain-containing protein [Methanoregula sp.]|uniref:zinc ribbon domain-containing protein n=1 Tax=Methanoregula sp. TaxID=2052170 RepID=UPI003C737906